MITRLRFILKRYWPAWLVAFAIAGLLYGYLPPRPIRQAALAWPYSSFPGSLALAACPTGRSLAYEKPSGTLSLYDFTTHKHHDDLGQGKAIEQFTFTAEGVLIYTTFEPDWIGGTHAEIHHFDPRVGQRGRVASGEVRFTPRDPAISEESRLQLKAFGHPKSYRGMLAPDGGCWLHPVTSADDELTFQIKHFNDPDRPVRLALKSIDLNRPWITTLEAQFSPDHRVLLLQHREGTGVSTRYRLRWFDTADGKELGTTLVSEVASTYLMEIGVVSNQLTYARVLDTFPRIVVFTEFGRHCRYVEYQSEHFPGQVDFTTLTQPWLSRGPEVPGGHWITQISLHDLARGEVRASQEALGSWSSDVRTYMGYLTNEILTTKAPVLLPGGRVLVIKQASPDRLVVWFEKLQTWLGAKPRASSDAAVLLDLTTGTARHLLRCPGRLTLMKASSASDVLVLAFAKDKQLHCFVYDAHLRAPWLFIVLWSATGFAAVVILLELPGALRRVMRSRSAVTHSPESASSF
jgi:hypothetical protein